MALLPLLYVGAKLWTRAPLVPYAEMDFKSGLQEVLEATYVFPSLISSATKYNANS